MSTGDKQLYSYLQRVAVHPCLGLMAFLKSMRFKCQSNPCWSRTCSTPDRGCTAWCWGEEAQRGVGNLTDISINCYLHGLLMDWFDICQGAGRVGKRRLGLGVHHYCGDPSLPTYDLSPVWSPTITPTSTPTLKFPRFTWWKSKDIQVHIGPILLRIVSTATLPALV